MNTLTARIAAVNKSIQMILDELAQWECLPKSRADVRIARASLILLLLQYKQRQAILMNQIENKRADLQAREFEAMNRYEQGLDS